MSKALPALLLLPFLLFFSPTDSLLRLLFLLSPLLLYGAYRLGKRLLPSLSPLALWGLLFLLSAASLTLFHSRFPFLGGDEPHYVLMAQSLVEDGDLNLRNNYNPKKYAPFHPAPLVPHSHAALAELGSREASGAPLSKSQGWYPFHSPGTALLLAPGYLLIKGLSLGIFWSVFALRFSFLLLFFLALLPLFRRRSPFSLEKPLSPLFLLSPLLFFSFHLYPEAPGFLLSLYGYLYLFKGDQERRSLWKGAVLLALLPLFHTKFLILQGGILLARFLFPPDRRPRISLLPALLLPLSLSILFNSLYLYVLYGSASPTLLYEGVPALLWLKRVFLGSWVQKGESFLGYWLDQRDGLLLASPLFFLTFPGFFRLWKREKREALSLLTPLLLYLLYYALLNARGAFCPPGRPLLPLLWIPLLFLTEKRDSPSFAPLSGLSLLFTLSFLLFPPLLYQPTTSGITERAGGLFQLLSNLYIDFPSLLPSFIKVPNWGWLPNLLFPLFLIFLALLERRFPRRVVLPFLAALFLASRVVFPLPRVGEPLRLKGYPRVNFTGVSGNLRPLSDGKGFFIVDNSYLEGELLFWTYHPLSRLSLNVGNSVSPYAVALSLQGKHLFNGWGSGETLTLPCKGYRKGSRWFYQLSWRIFPNQGMNLKRDPFILSFQGFQGSQER